VVVLDADATLVTVHSEKDQARATFKGGYGFHPLGVWCDNTHEMLAITLRPGNASSCAMAPAPWPGPGPTGRLLSWLPDHEQRSDQRYH
jgi:hypothetical protein